MRLLSLTLLPRILSATAAIALTAAPAAASQIWDWSYSASGITASGTLTTVDTPTIPAHI